MQFLLVRAYSLYSNDINPAHALTPDDTVHCATRPSAAIGFVCAVATPSGAMWPNATATMTGMPNPGPTTPITLRSYDYVLTLSDSEFAWEYLRRNADYQDDVRHCPGMLGERLRLASGQQVWRVWRCHPGAATWGLCSFRRCHSHGPRCAGLLARSIRRRHHRCAVEPARSACRAGSDPHRTPLRATYC